ncbi:MULTISPECIES: hypothetical protein [Chryseobacterium]|uniref:DUF7336 domain-containing protein n=1 Tax=Chryseobacterium TaxID=59732 RepID=UPI00192D2A48|nr:MULTISPECIES: hypothetical protein [Chryseobacterium]QRA42060.1 hypothetical protein JNG87_15710 [Chryseobacterium cucumeris]WFB69037.1 hypothetical protein PZ898_06355 [Chryseobacterium sp. WX]
MKYFLYSLEHVYTDESHTDCKLLGFFDNLKELEKTIDVVSKFSGFKDYPDGFIIKKKELDKIHWETGFNTEVGEIGRDYLPEIDIISEEACLIQNLKLVYNISHVYTINPFLDDERIIGVFSDLRKVEKVIEQLKKQPGFKEYPDDFIIDTVELNDLLWTSGF